MLSYHEKSHVTLAGKSRMTQPVIKKTAVKNTTRELTIVKTHLSLRSFDTKGKSAHTFRDTLIKNGRNAIFAHSLIKNIQTESHVHFVGKLPGQYLTAIEIDHCSIVEHPTGGCDICYIGRPYLVDEHCRPVLQQVRELPIRVLRWPRGLEDSGYALQSKLDIQPPHDPSRSQDQRTSCMPSIATFLLKLSL